MGKKCKKSMMYRIWHWYIKGEYHCDKCPYCWEGRTSYEYDEWDAGCYIKGDLPDESCRLLPPFRWIVGSLRKKKTDYCRNHEYDGFVEFAIEQEKKDKKTAELIEGMIGNYYLCWKDADGVYHAIDTKSYIQLSAWEVRRGIEEILCEIEHKKNPYQNPWKKAVLWTWKEFIGFFKPYFCE